MSCGLNCNFLFLPFILLSIIYYFGIDIISYKIMKMKYFLEIFIAGYAGYLFLYKVIIYCLIQNDNQSVKEEYKDYYIDFGVCILKDIDSFSYFLTNFLPEMMIIAASGYGILISFKSRLLKKTDSLSKNITNVKLTKRIVLIYLFFVAFTYFHFSYLGLFYMLCLQFVMLLNSLKFNDLITIKIYIVLFNCYYIFTNHSF